MTQPSSRYTLMLSLCLLSAISIQAQSGIRPQRGIAWKGVGAGMALFEMRPSQRRPSVRAGVGAGFTLRASFASPDQPELEVEAGLLLTSRPAVVICGIVGPCRSSRRELHGTGLARVGIVWPLTDARRGWYLGGSVAGYFPGSRSDVLPGNPVGVEARIGRRGTFGTGTSFAEVRLGYLVSDEHTGHTLQMLVGALY